MCRKNYVFAIFLAVVFEILFFSCSADSSIDLSSGAEETLRQLAAKKEEELLWTRELESVRLTKEINTSSAVSSSVKLSPEIYSVSNSDFIPLYPSISGFGSLNTTEISAELKKFLDEFSNSVAAWKLESSYMKTSSVFSLVVFKYDVEHKWKSFFGKDFEISEENPLFSSFFYGEPFFEEQSIIVPVRFKNESGFIDIHLYIDKSDEFKVVQIFIQNWGK